MGKGTKYAIIGGLTGLLFSEAGISIINSINESATNLEERMGLDLIGYALFFGVGSLIAMTKYENEYRNGENLDSSIKDYIPMVGNTIVPAIIGLSTLF